MGNTFPLSGGGMDAVEGVFGDGRAPAVRRSAAGRRSDERGLSRVRHFAQDRLQDLRPHMAAIRRRQERKRSSRCQVRTGLPAGGGSLERTRLSLKFPVSRENTGNFIDFGHGHPNSSSKRLL